MHSWSQMICSINQCSEGMILNPQRFACLNSTADNRSWSGSLNSIVSQLQLITISQYRSCARDLAFFFNESRETKLKKILSYRHFPATYWIQFQLKSNERMSIKDISKNFLVSLTEVFSQKFHFQLTRIFCLNKFLFTTSTHQFLWEKFTTVSPRKQLIDTVLNFKTIFAWVKILKTLKHPLSRGRDCSQWIKIFILSTTVTNRPINSHPPQMTLFLPPSTSTMKSRLRLIRFLDGIWIAYLWCWGNVTQRERRTTWVSCFQRKNWDNAFGFALSHARTSKEFFCLSKIHFCCSEQTHD